MTLTNHWEKAQDEIKNIIGKTSYDTWFSTIAVAEKDPCTLLIQAPDDFFKSWIVEHYQNMIEEIMGRLNGSSVNIEFSVNPQILEDRPEPLAAGGRKQTTCSIPSNLNSRFTFDNFVVGPGNRFACAASLAVAESPASL